jgi:serine phosphatase RsbU (regulator of sigma subunit)
LPLLLQLLYNASGQPFRFIWIVAAISLLQSSLAAAAAAKARAAWRDSKKAQVWRLAGVAVFLLLQTQNVPSPWVVLAPVDTPLGLLSLYSVATVLVSGVLTATLILGLGATHQRLSSELEAARAVQQLLLPRSMRREVEAIYLPASEVGGDFYFTESVDGGLFVVVGDVSGKGLKAAMIVSVLLGALRARRSNRPAEALAELNRVAAASLAGGGFVTAIAARIEDGQVTIANAGNPAPYAAGVELEVECGLPLGIALDSEYAEREFARPEQLTFVSDGVVEASNAAGDLFGFERTRELSDRPATEIAETARAWGQNDDITVVTIRRHS